MGLFLQMMSIPFLLIIPLFAPGDFSDHETVKTARESGTLTINERVKLKEWLAASYRKNKHEKN